ncbi:ATP-binding protein [Clostridium sp.]|uniref:ATP-binding protein n=1 Tax=Clostridium sp. TaxID=1506 RepID=UPI001A4DA86A|nr:ATP-binding protein [Clostridium sp.]MBK5241339.1 PAS domain S-box protein [Clostridium sp.]
MKNRFVKFKSKSKNINKYIAILFSIVIIVCLIFFLIWSNYKNFRDSIINNEQENLLTIAEMTGRSLETSMDEQRLNLEIIAQNYAFQEKFNVLLKNENLDFHMDILEVYYKTQQEMVQSVELLDKDGVILEKESLIIDDKESIGNNISNIEGVREVIKDNKVVVGKIEFEKEFGPTICLLQPVFYKNEFIGIIRSKLSLNVLYKKIVQPIKVGDKGYASVKDENGVLLMHPKGEDIGENVMDARQGQFPEYDWSELDEIVQEQKKGGEGVNLYYSIWPGDEDFKRIKKISAFAPAYIGDEFWIVTVTMDYKDVVSIIKNNLYNTLVLAGVLILIFILVIKYVYKIKENQSRIEVEAKYVSEVETLNVELKEDIEERKLLQVELIRNKEKYEVLFSSGSDCIFVLNINDNFFGNFLEVNDKACAVLGYSKEEICNMEYYEIIFGLKNDKNEEIKKALRIQETVLFEAVLKAKDGSTITVEINTRLFKLQNQQKLVLISRDITNRKIEEETLIRSEERFRSIINIVASQISLDGEYKEFFESINKSETDIEENDNQKMIIKLEKINMKLEKMFKKEMDENKRKEALMIYQSKFVAMGEMIGNIAHQWRQPLSILALIITNIEDMHKYNDLDEETLESLIGKSRNLIDKMSQTIDDFRYFFKPTMDKESFSLYDSIFTTIELIEENFKFHKIQCNIKNIDNFMAYGYSNQYSQVIFNIINNAIDALSESNTVNKQIDIEISSNGLCNTVKIKDNAGGIDELIAKKIFEPYFTTKNKKQGTGLGLYMSKMIIEKNFNGSIKFYNVDGGACFNISIPVKEV